MNPQNPYTGSSDGSNPGSAPNPQSPYGARPVPTPVNDISGPRPQPAAAAAPAPAPGPGPAANNSTGGTQTPATPAAQPTLTDPGRPTEPRVSRPTRRETTREIISTIGVLLAALLVAFGLIAWVFQSYQVDGPSMMNTLQNNDRLIVWKVPRTIAKLTHKDYIPKRGEIIIFVEGGLAQFGQDDTKQLIKRVIALPGERVVIDNGILTVYNKEHPEGFQPDKIGNYKIINQPADVHNIDITLADNQLFVCGDNRPDSLDSRTFGPINADQVVGRLALRLLPVSQMQKFD
jgi:signal peptidase I